MKKAMLLLSIVLMASCTSENPPAVPLPLHDYLFTSKIDSLYLATNSSASCMAIPTVTDTFSMRQITERNAIAICKINTYSKTVGRLYVSKVTTYQLIK